MSRARVIIGTDARGRPVTDWEKAPVEAPPYPHMQRAFEPRITKRRATQAELRAANETPPGYLDKPGKRAASPGPVGTWGGMATAAQMQESRSRGAKATRAAFAKKPRRET